MKKMKLMPVFVFALLLGATMIIASCEKEDIMTNEDAASLEARGGKNGKKGGNSANNQGSTRDICACIENNYPVEELSDAELNSLSHMLEEEKLARDVYLTMYDKWNDRVFMNISKAEQKHMDAILCLYKKYDIVDPVGDNAIGVFGDDALQNLYNDLIQQGNESLVAALTVGSTIEDLDIYDLIQESAVADNQDILAVFNELQKGSRNHMRAFISRLGQNNATYTPQFITQEMFDSIINSDRERGGSICGDNNGGKNGKGHKGKKGNKGKKGHKGKGNGNCNNTGNGGNGNGGNGNGGNGNGGNGNG